MFGDGPTCTITSTRSKYNSTTLQRVKFRVQ